MFELTIAHQVKLVAWYEECEAITPSWKAGAAGGRYTYCFTPTGLGLAIEVKDNLTKKEINLTDYDDW